jgi:membrane protein implicated in regulation of membrane protease activity
MFGIAAPWLWIIAALLLTGLEALLPGLFLFWVGVAALATGLLAFVMPLGWVGQFLAFALFGAGTVLLGRLVARRQRSEATDAPHLNQRGAAVLGRIVPLHSRLSGGEGTIRIDDTVWRVTGPDLPVGSPVRLLALQGTVFLVEPAGSEAPHIRTP